MISKEDFNKVWKDSTREAILNQYYYDYMELQKVYSIIKEVREYIEENMKDSQLIFGINDINRLYVKNMNDILEILDKVSNGNE